MHRSDDGEGGRENNAIALETNLKCLHSSLIDRCARVYVTIIPSSDILRVLLFSIINGIIESILIWMSLSQSDFYLG